MLPNDPVMLLSYINTQLRDNYVDLEELCDSLGVDKQEIIDKLGVIGYFYDEKLNKFI